MAAHNELPDKMKALVLRSTSEPPAIETVPTPQPTLGSAVVRVLAASTISYMHDIYNGKRNYPFPMPIIPGTSAVGRVVAIGPDATKLKPGDLVFVDCTIRSRDDPADVFLAAIHEGFTPGSAKLMKDVIRDWTYAEYCRVPLESLTVLDEKRLTGSQTDGGLGLSIEQLGFVARMLVPYGGLRDIELRAGQTVIVAPATGPFGGAAVLVALAMGARVIAMGRNRDSLAYLKQKISSDRVETVAITGDMEADCSELKKYGPTDAYFDIGPPEAHASTHIKSCILALRHGARISLMGGYREDIPIPHVSIMHKNIRLYGKWMYEREDIVDLFKMVESGVLDLRTVEVAGQFPLAQWKEAWDEAADKTMFDQVVVINP
ncbi:hypothetical protein LTR37_020212 [Vermiconidia calcicola]|uniref:Uncharacterized protein n=1 Tax=Vermiconidia calcicola TaxID=1690605 RepID=A0ACC3MEY9_9PEZI|nr:hypothetical protein LTR37_020212 [Vermiconidia calcicola]